MYICESIGSKRKQTWQSTYAVVAATTTAERGKLTQWKRLYALGGIFGARLLDAGRLTNPRRMHRSDKRLLDEVRENPCAGLLRRLGRRCGNAVLDVSVGKKVTIGTKYEVYGCISGGHTTNGKIGGHTRPSDGTRNAKC